MANSGRDCANFSNRRRESSAVPRKDLPEMPTATSTSIPEELEQVSLELENQGPEATLKWMVDQFHPSLYVACSFQQEESVLLDMLHRIQPDVRIFYLDTDVLFAETYKTRDRLTERYGFEFE